MIIECRNAKNISLIIAVINNYTYAYILANDNVMNGVACMDMNITRQAVALNETFFEQTIEQSIDADFSLPDYCPDIVRVLKCRVVPRLTSKNLSGGSLNIEGIAFITLIYADENGKICSFEHEVDFQKIVSVGDAPEDSSSLVKICNDYMNCRAVTSRKMDIHGVLSIKIKITACKHNDIITDIDAPGMQLKRGSCPATNPLGFAEKVVVIEEELEISRGSGAVRTVLRNDVRTIVDECELIGNKAVIKGDIVINALYSTEEGNMELYENRIPYNQIIDINVSGDDCRCDGNVSVMSCSLKPRTNLSGEAKSFAFECKICISVVASCENDIPVVYDAFCTKTDVELETGDINFKKLDSTLNERYMCKKTLEFSENSFGKVIDVWCENKIGQTKIVDKTLMISGTALICLLSYDKDGAAQYYERGVDFEYSHKIDSEFDNLISEAGIETVSCAYTILGDDKLEAKIELAVTAQIFAVKSKRVIIGAELKENGSSKVKKAPLVVYYADTGESIWEISKRYNTECDSVMKVNALDNDILAQSAMLLIP